MRELGEGVWCSIPDDERGGVCWVRLRAWVVIITADFLAKMSLLPGMEGSRAHKFCSDCNYDTRMADADQPFSFYRRSGSISSGSKRVCRTVPELQTLERMEATLTKIRAAPASKQKQLLQEAGYNCTYFALDPRYGWAPDPTQCPQDILHLFPDGLLRHEGAWMVKVLCSLGLGLETINQAIMQYKGFPPDVRIPPLHTKLTEGTDGGRPRRDATLKMTGSQVMHFSLHRCVLWRPHQQARVHADCWAMRMLQHRDRFAAAQYRDAGASRMGVVVQARGVVLGGGAARADRIRREVDR